MCFSFLSFHRRTVKDKEDQGTHFLAGKLESSLVRTISCFLRECKVKVSGSNP
jgi:hypothetical protein